MSAVREVLMPTSRGRGRRAVRRRRERDRDRRRDDRRARARARPAAPARAMLLQQAGLSGHLARRRDGHDRRDDAGRRRSSSSPAPLGPVRRERRRPRDPRAGAPSAATSAPAARRGAARRPAGRAARARRAGALGRRRRRAQRAARALPRRTRRAARCSTVSLRRAGSAARSPCSATRTRTTTRCSPSSARARRGRRRSGSRRPGSRARRRAPARAPRRVADDPAAAGEAALADVDPRTTTRSPRPGTATKTLPVLVRRVLTKLEGVAHEPHRQRRVAHEIESGPLTTLLDVLREELGIIEPEGRLRAGRLRRLHRPRRRRAAPLVPDRRRARSTGAEVTTVEGLGTPEELAPLQQAFTHHYAAQCGFCTSGMLMAGAGLPRRAAAPTTATAIQEALGGHVCRCTGYVEDHRRRRRRRAGRLVRHLTRHRGRQPRDDEPGGAGMKAVGARIPRYDGVAHVTGRTHVRRRRARARDALGEGVPLAARTARR